MNQREEISDLMTMARQIISNRVSDLCVNGRPDTKLANVLSRLRAKGIVFDGVTLLWKKNNVTVEEKNNPPPGTKLKSNKDDEKFLKSLHISPE